jgi:uncharacterized phage protein (TIGR01671 family)
LTIYFLLIDCEQLNQIDMEPNRFNFRAWQKDMGMIIYPKKYYAPKYNDGHMAEMYNIEENEYHTINDNDDNFILMQSTGLLDKNDKEIFEGDIIELIWGVESQYENGGINRQFKVLCEIVIGYQGVHNWWYYDGSLCFKPVNITKKEFKKMEMSEPRRFCQFDPRGNAWERKIIGNVYENFNLLN